MLEVQPSPAGTSAVWPVGSMVTCVKVMFDKVPASVGVTEVIVTVPPEAI